jgi:hypothetical protein
MNPPKNEADWEAQHRARFAKHNRKLGVADDKPRERFSVTSWGRVPTLADLQRDLPGIDPAASDLKALSERLTRWTA